MDQSLLDFRDIFTFYACLFVKSILKSKHSGWTWFEKSDETDEFSVIFGRSKIMCFYFHKNPDSNWDPTIQKQMYLTDLLPLLTVYPGEDTILEGHFLSQLCNRHLITTPGSLVLMS